MRLADEAFDESRVEQEEEERIEKEKAAAEAAAEEEEEERQKKIAEEKFDALIDNVTDSTCSDENDMPNTETESTGKNAGLTESEIYDTVREYLLSEIKKYEDAGVRWHSNSSAGHFAWHFDNGVGYQNRIIGAHSANGWWHIYNDRFDPEHESTTNIIVREDHAYFLGGSIFNDFDRDFMYGLYEKLIKRLHDKEE